MTTFTTRFRLRLSSCHGYCDLPFRTQSQVGDGIGHDVLSGKQAKCDTLGERGKQKWADDEREMLADTATRTRSKWQKRIVVNCFSRSGLNRPGSNFSGSGKESGRRCKV